MKNKQSNNHHLMSALKSLYGRLSRLLVKIRSNTYHGVSGAAPSFDITSVLNKQIEDYAAHHKNETAEHSLPKDSNLPGSTATATSPGINNTEHGMSEGGITDSPHNKTESEFAQHLKQRKSSSVTQPHIGDSLKASAWEHIHTAIRHAKQGEIDSAKLHTKIAGQALDEAGHYLNDADYAELVYQIEHYFSDSKKEK